ncbi:MAG: glycosyltransferase family 1 protein [Variibacter sp.]|nr:glycosyltransferase family 1 protein [Variibacter sp.]
MRIAISTDCWFPQPNGVARTLDATVRELRAMGHDVLLITPDDFVSVPLPFYKDDPIVFAWYPKLSRMLREFRPDIVHISTQGLLGVCTRLWCWRNKMKFTTAFHTRFPEYAKIRHGVPESLLYRYMRFFPGPDAPVFVPSHSLAEELTKHGFRNLRIWRRGVDAERYSPRPKTWTQYPRPIHMYVGRVAAEKNIAAFLGTPLPGSKIVVGDGPQLAELRSAYPDAVYLGEKHKEELAQCYAEADGFVFPSLLDTFGLVVLEALASGVPVAAVPSPHLVEIFGPHGVVEFDDDLAAASRRALAIAPERCREVALKFSWRASTEQLLGVWREFTRPADAAA